MRKYWYIGQNNGGLHFFYVLFVKYITKDKKCLDTIIRLLSIMYVICSSWLCTMFSDNEWSYVCTMLAEARTKSVTYEREVLTQAKGVFTHRIKGSMQYHNNPQFTIQAHELCESIGTDSQTRQEVALIYQSLN